MRAVTYDRRGVRASVNFTLGRRRVGRARPLRRRPCPSRRLLTAEVDGREVVDRATDGRDRVATGVHARIRSAAGRAVTDRRPDHGLGPPPPPPASAGGVDVTGIDDARAHGEPISRLWASRATIYGQVRQTSPPGPRTSRSTAATPPSPTAVTLDDTAWIEAGKGAPPPAADLHARAVAPTGRACTAPRCGGPGRFLEAPFVRGGASLRRTVVAVRDGVDVGYVVYGARRLDRQRAERGDRHRRAAGGRRPGRGHAVALRRRHRPVPARVWDNAPVDHGALPWLVGDPRALRRRRCDALWLRIDDVTAALAGRRYPRDGALTFALEDQTWRLEATGGRGSCAPTTTTPDLHLDRASLSSMFLGGVSAATLARAGRLRGSIAAVRTAGKLLLGLAGAVDRPGCSSRATAARLGRSAWPLASALAAPARCPEGSRGLHLTAASRR